LAFRKNGPIPVREQCSTLKNIRKI